MRQNGPATKGPPASEAGGVLTIDLAALVANWRALAERAAPAECAAVVKADAYGCGIEPVVGALYRSGCRTFFVAHISEARRVRACAPDAVVYVLAGLHPGGGPDYATDNLRPILSGIEEVREWAAFRASGWQGGAGLHVDTGMNRLGLSLDDAAALATDAVLPKAGLSLLISHLAVADDPGHPLNARQAGLFREMRDLFPGVAGSLANSSGIFLGPDVHHDMVRPGAALYGVNPTPTHANPMQPVVRVEGRILQVREIETGDTVGYGAVWTARRPSRLAIVSLGYGDGVPRSAGASDLNTGADILVAGRRCPIAGRVSMDLIAADVTDLPDGVPRRGDWATLLGDTIDVDELAAHAGTIGYEVLTRLGHRHRRVYVGA